MRQILKRSILFLLILIVGISAKSQVYVGGTLAFKVKTEFDGWGSDAAAAFSITPEAGYYFSKRFAAGLTVPVVFSNEYTEVDILPYAHYDFAKVSVVDFFGELAMGWGYADYGGDGLSAFETFLRPGLKVNLNNKFALMARTNLLSYIHMDGANYLNIDILNGFEIGCTYKF